MDTKSSAIQNTLSNCRTRAERMVNKRDCAEITITFKPKWRDNFDNEEIIVLVRRYFKALPLNDIREVLLIPEYGSNLNIHFHGLIRGRVKDLSTLKGFLNKRLGRSTISSVQLPKNYVDYILKEVVKNETTMKDIIYVYDDGSQEIVTLDTMDTYDRIYNNMYNGLKAHDTQ